MAIIWQGNRRIEVPDGDTPEWELTTKANQESKPEPHIQETPESNNEKDE